MGVRGKRGRKMQRVDVIKRLRVIVRNKKMFISNIAKRIEELEVELGEAEQSSSDSLVCTVARSTVARSIDDAIATEKIVYTEIAALETAITYLEK